MTTKTHKSSSIPKKIEVWLTDDSAQFCKAVIDGFADNRYMRIQRDFRSAEALLQSLDEEPDPPSAILLDVQMPGMDGLEAIAQIRKLSPSTRTIMLSCHEDEVYVREALQQGASGYLLKPSSPLEIENAVRAALVDLMPMDKAAMKKLTPKRRAEDLRKYLTIRERKVYRLAAEGLSRNEIAKRLSVSSNTVHFHLRNIYLRLSIHNRSEIIRNVADSR